MGCTKLKYQNFSFLEVIHQKNATAFKKNRFNGDHLGNVRLSYSDNILKNGIIEQNEIIEENNYYPFGLKHKGYNSNVSSNGNSTAQKYKYNGKELQDELGLNLYSMDFRQYDPAIGRWNSIDPITHFSMSTYTAFDNNPVFWADPSGADPKLDELINKIWNNTPDDGLVYHYDNQGEQTGTSDPNETSESITYSFKGNGKHELTLNTTSTYTTYSTNPLTGERIRKVTYKHTSVTIYLLLKRDNNSGYISGSYEILQSSEDVVIISNTDDYLSKVDSDANINKPVKIGLYSLTKSEGGLELIKQVKFLRKLNADNGSVNANYLNVAETNLSAILGYGGVATTVAAMAGKDKRFYLFVAAAGAGNSVGNEIRKNNIRKSAVIWER
jgi:RHS repeat-associated protein